MPRRNGQRMSLVHRLALAAVWLSVATGAIVFTEPAPTDVLSMGIVVLLPVIGLVSFNRGVLSFAVALMILTAFGFVGSMMASDLVLPTKHTAISLYLCLAAIVLAGFVALKPRAHAKLLLDAQLAGALFAATAGIVGYFDLVPGSGELLTRFGRASGTFKDPNVLGPYLVPAIIYALHVWLSRPLQRSALHAIALAVLSLALLLTFSRGAWAAAALAATVYLYISFVTSRRDADRVRIIALVGVGVLGLAGLLAVTLSHDSAGDLFAERASLTQSYDVGPEGRFGGQRKAIDLIAENPLGIGFGEFPRWHHHEDVHNVYLSMLLNAGWIGGAIYIGLVVGIVTLGLHRAFAPGPLQGPLLVAATSLAAMAFEGLIVDTDHWRHFYLLLALVVGLLTGRRTREAPQPRSKRIVTDRRPVLLRPVVVLPPAWRSARIVGPGRPLIAAAPPGRRKRRGLDLGIDAPPGVDYAQFCNRPARLLGPVRPKRRPRLVAPPPRAVGCCRIDVMGLGPIDDTSTLSNLDRDQTFSPPSAYSRGNGCSGASRRAALGRQLPLAETRSCALKC